MGVVSLLLDTIVSPPRDRYRLSTVMGELSSLKEDSLICFEELSSLVEAETGTPTSLLVVDVRSPAEAEKHGRIPGSVSLPLRDLESVLGLPDTQFTSKVGMSRDQVSSLLLVTYCRSGPRAVTAAKILQKNGYRSPTSFSIHPFLLLQVQDIL